MPDEPAAADRPPAEVISDRIVGRASAAKTKRYWRTLPPSPFPDGDVSEWERDETSQKAHRFVAPAELAAARRLKPAIRLFVDRAS